MFDHVPRLTKTFHLFAVIAAVLAGAAGISQAQPIISELMAANSASLADADGAYSDWIEIHNPDAAPVDLSGWYLTDNASNKTKWQFPAVTLPPNGYLLVFASNKNRRTPEAELHTNFALSADGEYLGLIAPDGITAVSEFAPGFPAQSSNVSYGFASGDYTQPVFFSSPTPGAANGIAGRTIIVNRVQFSHPAGPFRAPFSIELSGGGPGEHIRFDALPSTVAGAAVPEVTAESQMYVGPIQIDAPVVIRAAVFSDDLSARGVSASVQYFQIDLTSERGLVEFSTRLPVIVLEQHGFGGLDKADGEQPSWVYGYTPGGAGELTFAQAPEFGTPAIMSVRGTSSANFPKRSFNLDLLDDVGGKSSRSLFGFPAADEWALVGPWLYDPSLLRNSFMYSLSNRLGRWAPRTQPVEVFLNSNGMPLDASAYFGVYLLTDKVKIARDRVNLAEMPANATDPAAITGGYLLKVDIPDENEFSWKTDHGLDVDTQSSVLVASPKIDKLSPAQRDYIRDYVQRMENALHSDRASGWATRTYQEFLDRASWVDFHLLNTFSANPDALERSAYFTKDRGGRIVAGPLWDFDRALGSFADERSLPWDAWHAPDATMVWHFGWWGVIAGDPEFRQDWVDRWQSLRGDALADQNLTSLLDDLAARIGPEAAARDAIAWEDNISAFGGTHAGEVEHMKDWAVKRARWIDEQFVPAPTVTADSAFLTVIAAEGTQIVYTVDGSDPRSLGGDIAPNAIVSAEPVIVPAGSNLQARGYRADFAEAFPATPWSSAVGGPRSTPLSPGSRLVNLSSRGMVGSGERALVTGVVLADISSKSFLARAIGPGLAAFGATHVVADPQLSVLNADGVELLRNSGWQSGSEPTAVSHQAQRLGAFPLADTSPDSALIADLQGRSFSFQVSTPTGHDGLGLAELYELAPTGRTLSHSVRAMVGTGDSVLITGFVIRGTAHKRLLIRAVGPTLGTHGVSGVLADPVLALSSGSTTVATNDRWESTGSTGVASASTRVGAFNLEANSEDAALLITLAPGAYTVEVRSKDEAAGIVLLEIYEVP